MQRMMLYFVVWFLCSFLLASPVHAQATNPFVREQSSLLQQLKQQQVDAELEKEMAAEKAADTSKPAGATTAAPAFNVTPEMLQMVQPQGEELDYSNIFLDMNVVAISGKKALLNSTDYFYYIKDGGSFTHQGQQFFVEVEDGSVTVLSAQGTRVYVGSVGSGLKIEETIEASTSNTSSSNSSSSSSSSN